MKARTNPVRRRSACVPERREGRPQTPMRRATPAHGFPATGALLTTFADAHGPAAGLGASRRDTDRAPLPYGIVYDTAGVFTDG